MKYNFLRRNRGLEKISDLLTICFVTELELGAKTYDFECSSLPFCLYTLKLLLIEKHTSFVNRVSLCHKGLSVIDYSVVRCQKLFLSQIV